MKSNVCVHCYLRTSRDILHTISTVIYQERKKKGCFHSLSWLVTTEQNERLHKVTHNLHVFKD
jgi:hypothetical protein